MSRIDGRAPDQLRNLHITPGFMPNSGGSCFIEWGNTRVLVTANADWKIPPFLEGTGRGWLTAEYAMLPGSTGVRKARERLRSDSRSIEIQRLIGRSLRSIMDFTAIPQITITVDADVVQADGGTRTASITGGYVAVALLIKKLLTDGLIERSPLGTYLAAVSAGILNETPLLDLCYQEDSRAQADMNYVAAESGDVCEIQISGEKRPVSPEELSALFALCKKGVRALIDIQKEILEK